MGIKSNIAGMARTTKSYDRFKDILHDIREELVDIMTDVDDYWSVRSGIALNIFVGISRYY